MEMTDKEWYQLMLDARQIGLTTEEVRDFLMATAATSALSQQD